MPVVAAQRAVEHPAAAAASQAIHALLLFRNCLCLDSYQGSPGTSPSPGTAQALATATGQFFTFLLASVPEAWLRVGNASFSGGLFVAEPGQGWSSSLGLHKGFACLFVCSETGSHYVVPAVQELIV